MRLSEDTPFSSDVPIADVIVDWEAKEMFISFFIIRFLLHEDFIIRTVLANRKSRGCFIFNTATRFSSMLIFKTKRQPAVYSATMRSGTLLHFKYVHNQGHISFRFSSHSPIKVANHS